MSEGKGSTSHNAQYVNKIVERATEKLTIQNVSNTFDDSVKKCLWVIDMQNDFLDIGFDDNTLMDLEYVETVNNVVHSQFNGNNLIVEIRATKDDPNLIEGRFAVREGNKCIEKVNKYINDVRFHHIFVSRDVHTVDENGKPHHCSFQSDTVKNEFGEGMKGDGFPAHCVAGSKGNLLNPKVLNALNDKQDKTTYLIKGCNETIESFAAVPYVCTDPEKAKKRQYNNCKGECKDNDTYIEGTGSWVINSETGRNDNFQNSQLDHIKTDDNFILKQIKNVREDETPMAHYVCGLAGDFCVRDTAINLKLNYPNDKVYILIDGTRFPSLPISVVQKIKEKNENGGMKETKEDLEAKLSNEVFTTNVGPCIFITNPKDFYKSVISNGVNFAAESDVHEGTLINRFNQVENNGGSTQNTEDGEWSLKRFIYYMLKSRNETTPGGKRRRHRTKKRTRRTRKRRQKRSLKKRRKSRK